MILEVALLDVRQGSEAEFEATFQRASLIIARAQGYLSHQLHHSLEKPSRYVLLVYWDTLESHTIRFRQSAGDQEWKRLLYHFYNPFPTVEHFQAVESVPV